MNKNILGMALVAGSIAFSAGAQAAFLIDDFSDDTALTSAPAAVNTALTNSDFATSRDLSMDTPVGPGGASFIVFSGGLGTSADLFTSVNTVSAYQNLAGVDFTTAEMGPAPIFNAFVLELTSIDQGGVDVSLVINGVSSAIQSLGSTHTQAIFQYSEFSGANLSNVTDIAFHIHNNIAVDASFDSLGAFGGRPPVQTPEPATFALMGLGLAGLGFRRKAKKA